MIQTVYGIRSELHHYTKPVRSADYRRFVKGFPCAACGQSWLVDPAHTGPHGLRQKASDLLCIPLCRRCHELFDAAPQSFCQAHGLDVPVLIEQLNRVYEETVKGKVA